MKIGTAVPDEKELNAVIHHFIQNRSIFEDYNVGSFETDALKKLEELFLENPTQIMVGGSGLYVDAVLKGLDYFPEIDIVSTIVDYFDSNPDCQILSGHISYYNFPETMSYPQRTNFHYKNKMHLYNRPINQQCIFSRKELFQEDSVGKLNTDYALCADYEWLIKALNRNINIQFINKVFANADYTGVSYTENNKRIKEKRHIILKNSTAKELLL